MLILEQLKQKLNNTTNTKPFRSITLPNEELKQLEDRMNTHRAMKQRSYIGYSKNLNNIHSVIGSCEMLDGIVEQHYVINPHIIYFNEERLVQIFRKWVIRFYKKELGQYFYKKKDKQITILINDEYGKLNKLVGEKHTHLDMIIQHKDAEFLKRFHHFMRAKLLHYFPNLEYWFSDITTTTQRLNCYNYSVKEDEKSYSNMDLYYSLPNTTKAYWENKRKNKTYVHPVLEILSSQKVDKYIIGTT